jgi:hypothetical protein
VNRALCFVEIDVDYCSLSYGVSPCTASIPTTGAIKCFNTLKTCQDSANFANAPVTLRFAMPTSYLPKDIAAIPSIRGVSYSPAILSLGEDLGQRAKVSVTFEDHPHSDTGAGFDKYLADRTYDPFKRGSFWSKFRARQPFLQGRKLRLIRGFLGQALEDMETRHFLIESFDGPTSDGTYTLTAKDTLKLADGDRAQAPRLSNGFLSGNIDNDDTAASLSPTGIGDLEYPSSGFVNIGGKEICAFTRSGNSLTLTRAQKNTSATSHAANERVQLVLSYSAQTPAFIIHDLLTNYADVDPAYITLSEWETEVDSFFGRLCTADIADPVAVGDLVSELIQEAALAIWWDDLAQKLRLKVIRAVSATADVFSDVDNIMEGSLQSQEQPNRRISTVQTFFGKRNPLEGQDDPSNYLSCVITSNTDAIEQYGFNAIKTIFSRWIPFGGLTIAERLNGLQLGRFRDGPRRINFDVFRLNGITPQPGAGYQLEARHLQDATGAQEQVPIQITSVNPTADRFQVEAEEMRFDPAFLEEDDVNERRITIDVSSANINVRTIHDTLYPAPTEGDATSGVTVVVEVQSGVVVSSSSQAQPALQMGTWPTGWDEDNLFVDNFGTIQGAGGRGGGSGGAAQAGGTAFYTRHKVTFRNKAGSKLWGGGGGGGRGQGRFGTFGGVPLTAGGGGGGGGAGVIAGPGGMAPNATFDGDNGASGTASARGSGGDGGSGNAMRGGDGGNGGGPGLAGSAGANSSGAGSSSGSPGSGGAAGAAIDGWSYVTLAEDAGDRRGSTVN